MCPKSESEQNLGLFIEPDPDKYATFLKHSGKKCFQTIKICGLYLADKGTLYILQFYTLGHLDNR